MSDSASAFIEQLRAPPTSGEESGSASDFAFEATPAASAGGAAAGGLSNQFATVDEMGESFRLLLFLFLLLVTGRALRDIVTYPTRVSISLLPKLTPPSLSPSTTTQTSEVCIYSQPQQCNVVVSSLKCDELQTQTQTVTRRAP